MENKIFIDFKTDDKNEVTVTEPEALEYLKEHGNNYAEFLDMFYGVNGKCFLPKERCKPSAYYKLEVAIDENGEISVYNLQENTVE